DMSATVGRFPVGPGGRLLTRVALRGHSFVVAVAFGIAHGYQRAVGVVRAGVLGVLLGLPVLFTGSLYPAVVAHFWINLAIGLGGWRTLVPPGEREGDS
ncbi:MAG: type II CAAX prenyl endopeptidase Rce1 family protein, partial [Gemmatimonadota bacterium]